MLSRFLPMVANLSCLYGHDPTFTSYAMHTAVTASAVSSVVVIVIIIIISSSSSSSSSAWGAVQHWSGNRCAQLQQANITARRHVFCRPFSAYNHFNVSRLMSKQIVRLMASGHAISTNGLAVEGRCSKPWTKSSSSSETNRCWFWTV